VDDAEFRLTSLSVDPVTDIDGDGQEDNHLPTALAGVDALLPDQGFGLAAFNERLADNVENYTAILFSAHAVGDRFSLDLWDGLVQPDLTVAVDPASEVTVDGSIASDYAFSAGPGDIPLQFVVLDSVAPVSLVLYGATVEGDWADPALNGTFDAVIAVDDVVAQIVAPGIPDDGWDLDGDGVNEPKDAILALVDNLAPSTADTLTQDGRPAISVRMLFASSTSDIALPGE
jgi:hypothetical protein